ncbi:MAG: MATE family efflux transporter [Lachnospiraceae bacterium]|nr:MATE family efflux transporter [Bacteroides sp.]MBQ7780854.1 MATE family efflux transporter [Lachnospiraceae bacterium]
MSNKENTTIVKENKMGTMPVTKLLVTMSLPMMMSMLVQALYNIVDSIFVAQVNEYAVRAVSLSFPIQTLMIGAAVGSSVGVNALLSRALGEKNYEKVNSVASNGVFAIVVCYLIFLVVGFTVVKPFMYSQTDVPEVRAYGVSYLTICCVLSFGVFLQCIFEKMLQSTGKTFYTMITQGTGAIVNIILDPILIFGLFGFPRMEAAGAAIATVVGQIVAAVVAIIFHFRVNKEVRIQFKGFRPSLEVLKQIYAIGAPSIVMQCIGSVMTYGMNLILAVHGVAQTAFGLYFKLQSFIFMPIFGLNNGMVPIVAYNYGAGNKERVVKTMKVSVCLAVAIMLCGLTVMELIPDKLLMLFNADAALLAVGVPALRIICLSFIFAGFCIVVGSVFQALGNGWYSMFVSVARQLVVLLPTAYLLSLTGKVTNIWWSFPIAELMSVGMTTFFLIKIYRELICHIGEDKADVA